MKYTLPAILLSTFMVHTASAAIQTEGDWGKAQFYGSLRLLLTHEKGRDTDVADGISRLGLKGFINLDHSWQGTYRIEGRVIADSGTIFSDQSDFHERVTYIGLKNNDIGEVRLGKQYSPHYLWTILPIDITLHNPRHYNVRWNATENSSIREANSISYFTPKYNGFSFAALAEIDRADSESSGIDSFNIAAKYNSGPWQVALSYYDRSDNLRINGVEKPDADTIAATLQYKQGNHKAVLRYQTEDISDGDEFKTLGGYYAYNFDNYQGLEAQARIYNLNNGAISGNQLAIGLTKKFAKKGQVFIEYVKYDDDAKLLKTGRNNDVTLGYKLNF